MYSGDFLYIYFFLNFVFHYLKTHNNLFFDGSNDELTFLSTSSFSLFCLSLSSLCFCKISRIRWRELEDVESGVIETELAPLVPPWLLVFWFFSITFLEAKSAAKRMAMASSLRSWNYDQNSDKFQILHDIYFVSVLRQTVRHPSKQIKFRSRQYSVRRRAWGKIKTKKKEVLLAQYAVPGTMWQWNNYACE